MALFCFVWEREERRGRRGRRERESSRGNRPDVLILFCEKSENLKLKHVLLLFSGFAKNFCFLNIFCKQLHYYSTTDQPTQRTTTTTNLLTTEYTTHTRIVEYRTAKIKVANNNSMTINSIMTIIFLLVMLLKER